jgi:ATP-dependent Lhr-like helicase
VILVNGALAAWLARGGRQLAVYLPEDEPRRSTVAREIATALGKTATIQALLVEEINGGPAADHPLAAFLVEAGFSASAMGFNLRRPRVEST